MKVLICGLPGSGKSTLAEPFADLIGGVWINADDVRNHYNDWDFTPEGRLRQAMRMKFLSDGVVRAGKIAVADFLCPTEATRTEFNPDYTVWMDTIQQSVHEDTNKMFQSPTKFNYHVSAWFSNTHEQLMDVVKSYIERRNV